MTRKQINLDYFYYLVETVNGNNYTKLLQKLHRTPFRYSIPMDGNRENDGINLRYRFGEENGYEETQIASYIDTGMCTVLEMLVALCIRCEENIMDGYSLKCVSNFNSFTDFLFHTMIHNLGLSTMTNEKYNEKYVSSIIDRFIERRYSLNGDGGLFKLNHPPRDLRNVEIWYQMNWYLDEIIADEGV